MAFLRRDQRFVTAPFLRSRASPTASQSIFKECQLSQQCVNTHKEQEDLGESEVTHLQGLAAVGQYQVQVLNILLFGRHIG